MSDERRYPRVLVVAVNPINAVQSNGLLMRSLFEGWPKANLAQVYFPFFHRFGPDGSVCTNYLRISPLGLAEEETHLEAGDCIRKESSVFGTAIRHIASTRLIKAGLVEPVRELLAVSPWLDRRLLPYARAFRPDVVYTLLGTLGVTRAAGLVARELDCPVVPHFTDHWIKTKFVDSPFGLLFRQRLEWSLAQILDRAPVMLAVSESMATAYRRRFDKDCIAFSTLIDEVQYSPPEPRSPSESAPLRVFYAGSLGLGRWTVLQTVGATLHKLSREGLHARLEIYCSDDERRRYSQELTVPGTVEVKEWVPQSRLSALLAEADVLLHVESSAPEVLSYTRFSLSTKIGYYMMAGRCLLLVGPAEAGSMQEIRRIGGGVVVPESDEQRLEEVMRRVLSEHKLRRSMGRRARELALEIFEATRQRERFRRVLCAAAAGEEHTAPLVASWKG